MFPIPFNFPFRKKDGSVTTIDDAISSGGGGGGGYVLPPATKNTLGGVKIGDGISVQSDGTISADGGGGGSFTPDYENERLIIGVHGDYNYFIPMEKEYVGDGSEGYEIKTNPESTQSHAKIDIYGIIYEDGEIISKELIKALTHDSDNTYEDSNISVAYNSGGASWVVTSKVPLYNESGDVYTSPLTWTYDTTVDYIMLLKNLT